MLLVAAMLIAGGASAAEAGAQAVPGKTLFAKPVSMRGTLGDAQIQVNLRTKTDYVEGVEGEYFVFGRSRNVLLAGELAGDDLLMEESENGTDVSGQWTGTLAGDTVSGEWESADGKVRKLFNLKVVKTDDGPKNASSVNTAATSKSR
jgi:hypothetical protein